MPIVRKIYKSCIWLHYDREANLDESIQSYVVMETRFDTISLQVITSINVINVKMYKMLICIKCMLICIICYKMYNMMYKMLLNIYRCYNKVHWYEAYT